MKQLVVIVCTGLLVAGCDSFYGVESRTTLHGQIDVACVNAALTSIPEAGSVRYQRTEEGSTEILPKPRNVTTVAHDWFYGDGGKDTLELIQHPDGWDFSNSRRSMGVPVPHEEMTGFVPLMQMVNRALQSRCGLPVGSLQAESVGETKPSEI
jgi:hypothetical protein